MDEPLQHRPEPQPALALLRDLRKAARILYRREAASICDYVIDQAGRTVVARDITDGTGDLERSPDPTEHATCTSFVVTLLTERRRTDARGPSTERQFLGGRTDAVLQTILSDFTELYRGVRGGARASTEVARVKSTADLPNWYNTPLHLSGVAAAIRSAGGPGSVPAGVVELGTDVATQIAAWLSRHRGFVPDIAEDVSTRNTYLTYWCVRSLTDWADLWPEDTGPLRDALQLALDANLDYLARILVANQVGIGSTFDAPDLVCTLSVVALASRRLRRRDEFIDTVLPHAVDVLLDTYVHVDGSFAPNQAVLEPRRGRSAIVVSSEELNAILIHAIGAELTPRHAVGLEKALNHAARKASGPRGWGAGASTSPDRRPAFVPAGALAFLRGYRDTLDRLISQLCAAELGVVPYAPDPQLDDFELPHSVAQVINNRVIGLIKDRRRRDLAVMSLVLSGPRSSAKDLIARKVAQELNWPIVVFDPVTFLREDSGSVVREVGRILDLVSELSDTVVFLDGIDDLVDTRTQRPLSWSMLGRIDRLSDRGRILLIIASSRPGRLGLTADRSGHLANVYTVSPPDDQERAALLEQFLDQYGATSDVIEALDAAGVVGHTPGFSEGLLQELVRTCVGHRLSVGSIDVDTVERALQALVQRRDIGEAGS